MTLKLWDLRKESAPVQTFGVHEQLRNRVGGGPMVARRYQGRAAGGMGLGRHGRRVRAAPEERGGGAVLLLSCGYVQLVGKGGSGSPHRLSAPHPCIPPLPLCAQLCDLYENDSIFDKFDCCMNGDASHIATGSYNNLFRVFGVGGQQQQGQPQQQQPQQLQQQPAADLTLEASRDPMRRRLQVPAAKVRPAAAVCHLMMLCRPAAWGRACCMGACVPAAAPSLPTCSPPHPSPRPAPPCRLQPNRFTLGRAKTPGKKGPQDAQDFGNDYASKLLHLAWHPEANVIACAAANSLYMYCA